MLAYMELFFRSFCAAASKASVVKYSVVANIRAQAERTEEALVTALSRDVVRRPHHSKLN